MGHSQPESADSSVGLVRITPTATEFCAAEQFFCADCGLWKDASEAIRLTPGDQAQD
jgi:hypothetical protein